jgi:hypothetical protein
MASRQPDAALTGTTVTLVRNRIILKFTRNRKNESKLLITPFLSASKLTSCGVR